MVLAIANGAYAAAMNGAVIGLVASVLCQAKVKEVALMVLIGASTSLIPVFLVRKIGLPKIESPKGLFLTWLSRMNFKSSGIGNVIFT